MEDRVRNILRDFGRLSVNVDKIDYHDDLYVAGLSSLATVNIMLAVEDAFDVEFPDNLLTRRSFQSIATLSEVIASLRSTASTS